MRLPRNTCGGHSLCIFWPGLLPHKSLFKHRSGSWCSALHGPLNTFQSPISKSSCLRVPPWISWYTLSGGTNLSMSICLSKCSENLSAWGKCLFWGDSLHCLFFFSFPTRTELLTWRISSVVITAVPIYIPSMLLLAGQLQKMVDSKNFTETVGYFGFIWKRAVYCSSGSYFDFSIYLT